MPTASAATPPPEDPPEVRPIFHGLCVAPNSFESVTPFQPYSGEVVLPSSTVPASRRRCATGESTFHGPASSVAALPMRVGMPLVSTMSLMVIGTPSMSLRRLPPFFQRFSEARAARSALSGSRCWKALSCGLSAFDADDRRLGRLDGRGLARLEELTQLVGRHHREIGSHFLFYGRRGKVIGLAWA